MSWCRFIACVVSLLVLASCSPDPQSTPPTTTSPSTSAGVPTPHSSPTHTSSALSTAFLRYAEHRMAKVCSATESLEKQVHAFLDAPEVTRLDAAKRAWLETRDALIEAHLLRHFTLYDPAFVVSFPSIHNTDNQDSRNIWSLVDAFPLNGGYLDRVNGYAYSGIVYSETPLSEAFLLSEYQFSDDTYLTLGVTAIEFMLWGENGQRGVTDYIAPPPTEGPENTEHLSAQRRQALLKMQSTLLSQHAATLCHSWNDNDGFVKTRWLSTPVVAQETLITTMMVNFFRTELMGQWFRPDSAGRVVYRPRAAFSGSESRAIASLTRLIQDWRMLPEVQPLLAKLNPSSDFQTHALLKELESAVQLLAESPLSATPVEGTDEKNTLTARIEHLTNQMIQRLQNHRAP